jgi:hypothetical protein
MKCAKFTGELPELDYSTQWGIKRISKQWYMALCINESTVPTHLARSRGGSNIVGNVNQI